MSVDKKVASDLPQWIKKKKKIKKKIKKRERKRERERERKREREREIVCVLQGVTRMEMSQRFTSPSVETPHALGKSDSLYLECFYDLV